MSRNSADGHQDRGCGGEVVLKGRQLPQRPVRHWVNAFQKHAVLPVAFSFGGGCEYIGDILHRRAVDAQQDEPLLQPLLRPFTLCHVRDSHAAFEAQLLPLLWRQRFEFDAPTGWKARCFSVSGAPVQPLFAPWVRGLWESSPCRSG